jgi:hypothetical protein
MFTKMMVQCSRHVGTRVALGARKPTRLCLECRQRACANFTIALLAAFSRPLSRCYPLTYCPAVLRLCRADETSSTQPTISIMCRAHSNAACGMLAPWVIRAHTSHSAATRGTQHSLDCLIRHARPHVRCDAAVLPVRHAGARFPIARAGSSSEDQVQLEGGQGETPVLDRQGQMRTDHHAVRKW